MTVIRFAVSDTVIMEARRLTEEEKKKYVKEFQEVGIVGIGGRIILKNVDWNDMPKRESDVSLVGSNSPTFVITDEEKEYFIKLDQERQREKDKKEKDARDKREETIRNYENKKQALLSQIDSWDIFDKEVADEGGKTHEYTNSITVNGRRIVIIERNIFDFGRVCIMSKNGKRGDLCMNKSGYHIDCDGERVDLDTEESIAAETVLKYGKYAHSYIRM